MNFKCCFLDLTRVKGQEENLDSFSKIVDAVDSFFKGILKDREEEEIFKDIFSPEYFRHLLEKYFLQENANVIEVFLKAGNEESFKSRLELNDFFFLTITLSEGTNLIAMFTIGCSMQDSQDLAQTIKEAQALGN